MTSTEILALVRRIVDLWADLVIGGLPTEAGWMLNTFNSLVGRYRYQKLAEERVKAQSKTT